MFAAHPPAPKRKKTSHSNDKTRLAFDSEDELDERMNHGSPSDDDSDDYGLSDEEADSGQQRNYYDEEAELAAALAITAAARPTEDMEMPEATPAGQAIDLLPRTPPSEHAVPRGGTTSSAPSIGRRTVVVAGVGADDQTNSRKRRRVSFGESTLQFFDGLCAPSKSFVGGKVKRATKGDSEKMS